MTNPISASFSSDHKSHQIMSNQVICGYTLVRQGTPDEFLNYSGAPLRRCTRCKGMCYVDQDAQKKHWKRHKHYCRLLADSEIESISSVDLDACTDKLKEPRQFARGGPELYYYVKRLRELYDEGADGTSDSAFRLHSCARGLIFQPSCEIALAMAASPNMAQVS